MNRFRHFFALLLMAAIIGFTPAAAHSENKHEAAMEAASNRAQAAAGSPQSDPMAEMMHEMEEERATMSAGERLLDWLGRLHPVIVHFPMAFFPAALFTAVVGRRRPAFAAPVQFLVVAGGIIAPIAAILGWLNAMGADPEPALTVHRWLGTSLGVAAIPLAIWAWRRPDQLRGTAMLVALAAVTAAIVVQGWYGGALVHGMDHMNW